jgi:hypothetical protein
MESWLNPGPGSKKSAQVRARRLGAPGGVRQGAATQAELVAEPTRLIQATGGRVFSGFPMINKIVELRLIGRKHPGMAAAMSVPGP